MRGDKNVLQKTWTRSLILVCLHQMHSKTNTVQAVLFDSILTILTVLVGIIRAAVENTTATSYGLKFSSHRALLRATRGASWGLHLDWTGSEREGYILQSP